MQKRWIAYLASAILLLASFSSIASAAVKTGAACTTLNATEIASGYIYTCIKSGKRLVWGKRTKVVVAKPTPTPTPTPPVAISDPIGAVGGSPTTPISGAPCQNMGARVNNSTGFLECRYVAGNALKFFQVSSQPEYSYVNTSPRSFETCRIRDYSNLVASNSRPLPTAGKLKVALVPIDFSDYPGGVSPHAEILAEIKVIKDWFNQFSNGKLQLEIITYNSWIRAPKTSQNYNWGHSGVSNATTLTNDQLVQDQMTAANPYFDFSNLNVVFFKYPKNVTTIESGIMTTVTVNTSQGVLHPFAVSQGYMVEKQGGPTWAYWIHELLHPLGLQGHAPGNGWPFSIMSTQSGAALNITTWDQLLLNWLDARQVYCDDVATLKESEVTLRSVDSNLDGVKSIMIKTSSHQMIVIESRRKDFWSSATSTLSTREFIDGFYGVMVYTVDADVQNDRSQESGGDSGNDPKYPKFAYFQKISDSHTSDFDRVGQWKYVMYEGENIVVNGVKISLVKSGDFDTVKLEKTSS